MKPMYLTIVAIATVGIGGVCWAFSEDAALKKATVTFVLPHGDDKDHDTYVAIHIDKGAMVIARDDDLKGAHEVHFNDPGVYGPFEIAVQTKVKKRDYRGSITTMRITTHGHDRWITNILIKAEFDDGETLSSESGNVIVDQDNRDAHFYNFRPQQ